jgi:hypothetical protein
MKFLEQKISSDHQTLDQKKIPITAATLLRFDRPKAGQMNEILRTQK